MRTVLAGPKRPKPIGYILLPILLLGGCASAPKFPHTAHECRAKYAAWDDRLASTGQADGQTRPVAGFPYLHVDRYLTQAATQVSSPEAANNWIAQATALANNHYRLSLSNLLGDRQRQAASDELSRCSQLLQRFELARPERRKAALAAAEFPDDYIDGWRVAGLYPLSSVVVRNEVMALHQELQQAATRMRSTALGGDDWQHYRPRPTPPTPAALQQAAWQAWADHSTPAVPPAPSAALLQDLFAAHAPVFAVQQASGADRIGSPLRLSSRAVAIDTSTPQVYTQWGFTRFEERTLLQLSYVVWFSARPKGPGRQLTGGKVDGLTWRVTLDSDGRPLLYDSIHNCGCYHSFWATERLQRLDNNDLNEEPLLTLPLPEDGLADTRPLLVISAGDHYLLDVRRAQVDPGAREYQRLPYDTLRALPYGGGRSGSFFDAQGFVPGSERAERFVLWPMGIKKPGAMRQWGHHATAFVGRRHFDEPGLISRYFRRATQP